MIYRIFIGFLVLSLAFVSWQLYDIISLKNKAYAIEAGQYIGNENGDIIVVEFLDYTCEPCRNIAPLISQVIAQDGQSVLIPRPVFSATSEGTAAAYTLYAAAEFDQFLDMHRYFMSNPMPPAETYMQDVALILGVDEESFQAAVDQKHVFYAVTRNYRLAQSLMAPAVPGFLIKHKPSGREVFFFPDPQKQSPQQFLDLFNELRQST